MPLSSFWDTSYVKMVLRQIKVQAINDVQKTDLMEPDGKTPCAKKIRSFLGMVLYYHHFIETKAKPLFNLVAELPTPPRGHKPKFKKGCLLLTRLMSAEKHSGL